MLAGSHNASLEGTQLLSGGEGGITSCVDEKAIYPGNLQGNKKIQYRAREMSPLPSALNFAMRQCSPISKSIWVR